MSGNILINGGISVVIGHSKSTGFSYSTTPTVKKAKPSSSTGTTSNSIQTRPLRQDNDD